MVSIVCAAAALLTLDGCLSRECTLIGCGPPLTIQVEGPGDEILAERPDPYLVELDFDGEVYRSECIAAGGELTCEELQEAAGFSVTASPEYGFGTFTVYEDGAQRGPERVTVRVSSGGEQLAEEVLEPVYDGTEINGEGCGYCYHAGESVEVPPPTS